MSYSRFLDLTNEVSEEICQSEKARDIINAVAPSAAKFGATALTGSPAAGEAASAAVRAAAALAPNPVAKIATNVAVGIALDAAVPAMLAGLAVFGVGYVTVKVLDRTANILDELFS